MPEGSRCTWTSPSARVTDLDGHELIDFSLGDTAAMAGHSPPPTVAAVTRRFAEAGGATAMMPPRTLPLLPPN